MPGSTWPAAAVPDAVEQRDHHREDQREAVLGEAGAQRRAPRALGRGSSVTP